jgi:hypothetical protein
MRFTPILAIATLLPLVCFAQDASSDAPDDAIHAVTTLHADGTRTVAITNPDTHTSEADTYNAANKLVEKIIYTLDENNQPASGVVYTPDNRPAFKTTYKRNDFNRVTEEDDYTMDDQLLRRFVYEYGAGGKVIGIRAYDAQGNELQQSDARKDERQSLPRVH